MSAVTQTITRTIVGINPIGNNVWQIEFNPAQTQITSNVSTNPVIYYSSSALPVILNPFLNNIGNFNNSDYNAIINNVIPNRLSEWYQQIDYATDQNIPVNFQQIISGTAYPAAVQDSNYTSYQYSGIRYWGSKNTTDNFNSPLTITSSIVQTYQNDNLGLTTLGYASVNKLDANILEFNWGGGTYPEIYGGGALSLNQILGVGATRNSVSRFSSTERGFLGSVDILFPINSLPVFNQYTTIVNTAVGARVSSIGFTVPAVSNYMIASPTVATTAQISASTNYITITGDLSGVNTNSTGNYITGSLINSSSFLASINQGFTSGERWFVTMYQSLPSPVVGVLEPLDLGYSNYTVENGYSYPLAAKGVFEITSSLASPVLPTSSYTAGQSTIPPSGQIGFINASFLPTSSYGAILGSSPSTGKIAFNSGVFTGPLASAVTNLFINDIDGGGTNRSSSLVSLTSSQTITLENITAGTGPFVYNITGTPIDNGTYFTVPVSWISGAGNLRISGDGGVTSDTYTVYTSIPSPLASSISNLYINDVDASSINISGTLKDLNSSQIITLENTTAGATYPGPFVYNITGTPIDNGTYFTVPVSFVSGIGNLSISGNGVSFDTYNIYANGNSRLILDIPNGTFTTGSQFGNGKNGMLVWKSQAGAYMTFNDATLSGLGKGSLVTSTPTPVIETEFTYITQEYGINPKNQ
jgi:hypothetical protein